jgi:hypothetical protein
MISGKSGNDFVTTILQALSNITVLQLGHYGHFTDTTHQTCLRLRLHRWFTCDHWRPCSPIHEHWPTWIASPRRCFR